MLQQESKVLIADNTGAKWGKIIKRLGQNAKYARVTDIVVIHIIESTTNATIKKGSVVKAVIVRTKNKISRNDGSYIRFDTNAAVIIDDNGNPKGTRVFGPVARELRSKNFMKIVSLAIEVL